MDSAWLSISFTNLQKLKDDALPPQYFYQYFKKNFINIDNLKI
jgi:hypothetical protein